MAISHWGKSVGDPPLTTTTHLSSIRPPFRQVAWAQTPPLKPPTSPGIVGARLNGRIFLWVFFLFFLFFLGGGVQSPWGAWAALTRLTNVLSVVVGAPCNSSFWTLPRSRFFFPYHFPFLPPPSLPPFGVPHVEVVLKVSCVLDKPQMP